MKKRIIAGIALTGNKYTPNNYKVTDNIINNTIFRGELVPCSVEEVIDQSKQLLELGILYNHIHARNPETREQFTNIQWYKDCSRGIQKNCPNMLISFGGSRNGNEVIDAVAKFGEFERLKHTSLKLIEGGSHFSTLHAAIELQIIVDMENKGFITFDSNNKPVFQKPLQEYTPEIKLEKLDFGINTTEGGSNYGESSPNLQFEYIKKAVSERNKAGLLHEVEWAQKNRSFALTKFCCDHPEIKLGGQNNRINIAILFGLSPKLPFPQTYKEFKSVIDLAKSLEIDEITGEKIRTINITVGASVMPQHLKKNTLPLDIAEVGKVISPLERLVCYSAQMDSSVNVVRTGLEDMPALLNKKGEPTPVTNIDLAKILVKSIKKYGASLVRNPIEAAAILGVKENERFVDIASKINNNTFINF
jgi:hypothetical protein